MYRGFGAGAACGAGRAACGYTDLGRGLATGSDQGAGAIRAGFGIGTGVASAACRGTGALYVGLGIGTGVAAGAWRGAIGASCG